MKTWVGRVFGGRSMLRPYMFWLMALAGGCSRRPAPDDATYWQDVVSGKVHPWRVVPNGETVAPTQRLLGMATREMIETEMPAWKARTAEATAPGTALGGAKPGSMVVVYFGNWCRDSARELPEWWHALDAAGTPAFGIRYVGLDTKLHAPDGRGPRRTIEAVPTFVVVRDAKEVGRVVEHAPRGIDVEVGEILRR